MIISAQACECEFTRPAITGERLVAGKRVMTMRVFFANEYFNSNGWRIVFDGPGLEAGLKSAVGGHGVMLYECSRWGCAHVHPDEHSPRDCEDDIPRQGRNSVARVTGYEIDRNRRVAYLLLESDNPEFIEMVKSGRIKYVSPGICPIDQEEDYMGWMTWKTVFRWKFLHIAFVDDPAYGEDVATVEPIDVPTPGRVARLTASRLMAAWQDQPRVPAGSSEGGRWGKGGGTAPASGETHGKPGRPARVDPPRLRELNGQLRQVAEAMRGRKGASFGEMSRAVNAEIEAGSRGGSYVPSTQRSHDLFASRDRAVAFHREVTGGDASLDPRAPVYVVAITNHVGAHGGRRLHSAYRRAQGMARTVMAGWWISGDGRPYTDIALAVGDRRRAERIGQNFVQDSILEVNPDGTVAEVPTVTDRARGLRQAATAAVMALLGNKHYDPNQPRDPDGKWTDTGAGGKRGKRTMYRDEDVEARRKAEEERYAQTDEEREDEEESERNHRMLNINLYPELYDRDSFAGKWDPDSELDLPVGKFASLFRRDGGLYRHTEVYLDPWEHVLDHSVRHGPLKDLHTPEQLAELGPKFAAATDGIARLLATFNYDMRGFKVYNMPGHGIFDPLGAFDPENNVVRINAYAIAQMSRSEDEARRMGVLVAKHEMAHAMYSHYPPTATHDFFLACIEAAAEVGPMSDYHSKFLNDALGEWSRREDLVYPWEDDEFRESLEAFANETHSISLEPEGADPDWYWSTENREFRDADNKEPAYTQEQIDKMRKAHETYARIRKEIFGKYGLGEMYRKVSATASHSLVAGHQDQPRAPAGTPEGGRWVKAGGGGGDKDSSEPHVRDKEITPLHYDDWRRTRFSDTTEGRRDWMRGPLRHVYRDVTENWESDDGFYATGVRFEPAFHPGGDAQEYEDYVYHLLKVYNDSNDPEVTDDLEEVKERYGEVLDEVRRTVAGLDISLKGLEIEVTDNSNSWGAYDHRYGKIEIDAIRLAAIAGSPEDAAALANMVVKHEVAHFVWDHYTAEERMSFAVDAAWAFRAHGAMSPYQDTFRGEYDEEAVQMARAWAPYDDKDLEDLTDDEIEEVSTAFLAHAEEAVKKDLITSGELEDYRDQGPRRLAGYVHKTYRQVMIAANEAHSIFLERTGIDPKKYYDPKGPEMSAYGEIDPITVKAMKHAHGKMERIFQEHFGKYRLRRSYRNLRPRAAVAAAAIVRLIAGRTHDEDKVNRHPKGAPEGKGGQFAPKNASAAVKEVRRLMKERGETPLPYETLNTLKPDQLEKLIRDRGGEPPGNVAAPPTGMPAEMPEYAITKPPPPLTSTENIETRDHYGVPVRVPNWKHAQDRLGLGKDDPETEPEIRAHYEGAIDGILGALDRIGRLPGTVREVRLMVDREGSHDEMPAGVYESETGVLSLNLSYMAERYVTREAWDRGWTGGPDDTARSAIFTLRHELAHALWAAYPPGQRHRYVTDMMEYFDRHSTEWTDRTVTGYQEYHLNTYRAIKRKMEEGEADAREELVDYRDYMASEMHSMTLDAEGDNLDWVYSRKNPTYAKAKDEDLREVRKIHAEQLEIFRRHFGDGALKVMRRTKLPPGPASTRDRATAAVMRLIAGHQDQPRHPKGSSDGGKWRKGGGGSSSSEPASDIKGAAPGSAGMDSLLSDYREKAQRSRETPGAEGRAAADRLYEAVEARGEEWRVAEIERVKRGIRNARSRMRTARKGAIYESVLLENAEEQYEKVAGAYELRQAAQDEVDAARQKLRERSPKYAAAEDEAARLTDARSALEWEYYAWHNRRRRKSK